MFRKLFVAVRSIVNLVKFDVVAIPIFLSSAVAGDAAGGAAADAMLL